MNQDHCYNIRKNQRRWTEEEHKRFKDYGKNWKMITRAVGTRSILQTRSHARKALSSSKSRSPISVGSFDLQPPCIACGKTTGDPERKNLGIKSLNCLIPLNLYGICYHTLKGAECFQEMQRQNKTEESISRLQKDSQSGYKPEEGNSLHELNSCK